MKNIPEHFKADGKYDPQLLWQSIEQNNWDTVAEYDGQEGAGLRWERGWLEPTKSQVEFYLDMWGVENWKDKDVDRVLKCMKS